MTKLVPLMILLICFQKKTYMETTNTSQFVIFFRVWISFTKKKKIIIFCLLPMISINIFLLLLLFTSIFFLQYFFCWLNLWSIIYFFFMNKFSLLVRLFVCLFWICWRKCWNIQQWLWFFLLLLRILGAFFFSHTHTTIQLHNNGLWDEFCFCCCVTFTENKSSKKNNTTHYFRNINWILDSIQFKVWFSIYFNFISKFLIK